MPASISGISRNRAVVIISGDGTLGRCLSSFLTQSGYVVRSLEKNDREHAPALLADDGLVLVAIPER